MKQKSETQLLGKKETLLDKTDQARTKLITVRRDEHHHHLTRYSVSWEIMVSQCCLPLDPDRDMLCKGNLYCPVQSEMDNGKLPLLKKFK